MSTDTKRTELPVGTRVHHRGQIWSAGFTEDERKARPSWEWATIIQRVPQGDGTAEYEVRYDKPHIGDGPETGWWASYHIDEWEIPAS